MKKIGTLNSNISRVISEMGHLDTLVVADAGLPIPKETPKIDLALTKGIPSFLQTLKTILSELEVEEAIVAQEIEMENSKSKTLFKEIKKIMGTIPVKHVSHEAFKKLETSGSTNAMMISDCLYDADKFRWGSDNFTDTI